MIYKYTLLKELPGYPVGYQFWTDDASCREKYGKMAFCADLKKGWSYVFPDFIADVLDAPNNSKWLKKAVETSFTQNLSCPNCGGTKVFLHKSYYTEFVNEDFFNRGYYTVSELSAECVCGNEYILSKHYMSQ